MSIVNSWRPISEILGSNQVYDESILLRAPELYDGDSNPYGVAMGYWQDDDDHPRGGSFLCPIWVADFDYYDNIPVNPTHFMLVRTEGLFPPFTEAEMEAAHDAGSDRYMRRMAAMQAPSMGLTADEAYARLKEMFKK